MELFTTIENEDISEISDSLGKSDDVIILNPQWLLPSSNGPS